MKLKIYQIDAFASKCFEGNPAAVISLESCRIKGSRVEIMGSAVKYLEGEIEI